jgi:hypothetical protein
MRAVSTAWWISRASCPKAAAPQVVRPSLRFRVGENAEIALHQNVATTARDHREALDNAARMPGPTLS